jgi:hypothetical protein
VQRIRKLVDPVLVQLGIDAKRLGKALARRRGSAQVAAPPDAVRAVASAQRHVLALKAQLEEFQTGHPAKRMLLAGLTWYADGLAATGHSLAATDVDRGSSFHRLAGDHLKRAGSALLAADRALGCVYGCKETRVPKVRRTP